MGNILNIRSESTQVFVILFINSTCALFSLKIKTCISKDLYWLRFCKDTLHYFIEWLGNISFKTQVKITSLIN